MSILVSAITTRRILGPVLLALCLAISGCSSLKGWWPLHYSAPEVELLGIDLLQVKVHQQELLLHLDVNNRSNLPLPLRSLEYSVHLDNLLLGSGEARPDMTIPPHGRRQLDLRLQTRLWPQLKEITRLLKTPNPAIPYRIDAEIDTGWLPGTTLSIQRTGTLSNTSLRSKQ